MILNKFTEVPYHCLSLLFSLCRVPCFEHAVLARFVNGLLIRSPDLNDGVAQFGDISERAQCLADQLPSRLANLGLRRVDTAGSSLCVGEMFVRVEGFNQLMGDAAQLDPAGNFPKLRAVFLGQLPIQARETGSKGRCEVRLAVAE